jgi:hypothetical protein
MVRRGTTLVVDGSLLFVVVNGDEGPGEKGLNNLGIWGEPAGLPGRRIVVASLLGRLSGSGLRRSVRRA